MTDRYGREIIDHGDGRFSVEGIELIADDLNAAIATFNAMAPAGWVDSTDEP